MYKIDNIKKYFEPIINVYSNFSVKRKLQFALLMPVFIGQAISELISLGSVIPFITALTNPNLIFLQISNYPFLKIHSSSETVSDVDFVDIDYSAAGFFSEPTVTATTDSNVNVFVSNITQSTARLNFSAKYTGSVKYTAISTKK